jgi:hypothetical protein
MIPYVAIEWVADDSNTKFAGCWRNAFEIFDDLSAIFKIREAVELLAHLFISAHAA